MWKCKLYTFLYNLRHIKHGLLSGTYLLGHDFDYTGEVHIDHWIMECKRCGIRAAIDVGPSRAVS